jgi:hypothetical protein
MNSFEGAFESSEKSAINVVNPCRNSRAADINAFIGNLRGNGRGATEETEELQKKLSASRPSGSVVMKALTLRRPRRAWEVAEGTMSANTTFSP